MAKRTKAGTKLTRREEKRLADEAEVGYDLSKGRRLYVPPGRPSLEEGESPRISYRVAPTLFEATKQRAKVEGRTVSELARDALAQYLAG